MNEIYVQEIKKQTNYCSKNKDIMKWAVRQQNKNEKTAGKKIFTK